MLSAALELAIDRRLRKLDCSGHGGRDDTEVVSDILRFWKMGARAGLKGWKSPRLDESETQVPWSRRLFFWEGYAFGVCGRHACLPRRGNPLADYHAPGYRFMFWTGLGFWNGVAWPFPTVSLAPERWEDVPEFQEEYSLVLGGAAFSQTASAGAIAPRRLERLAGVRGPSDLDGLYRGVGRALWFLYMHNEAKLAAVLDAHAGRAEALAQGLGIAITYTQLGTPERIFPDFASLPEKLWPALLSGARVALAGLVMEDSRVVEELCKLPPPLDALLAEARAALVTLASGPGWERRFVETCKQCTSLWSGLDAPAVAS